MCQLWYKIGPDTLRTQTCRDRYPRALLSLFELLRDLVDNTALDVESGPLLRTVSGKDHRTADEMFRGSKRRKGVESVMGGIKGANELPQLLGSADQGQDKKNRFPWNVVARWWSSFFSSPFPARFEGGLGGKADSIH